MKCVARWGRLQAHLTVPRQQPGRDLGPGNGQPRKHPKMGRHFGGDIFSQTCQSCLRVPSEQKELGLTESDTGLAPTEFRVQEHRIPLSGT